MAKFQRNPRPRRVAFIIEMDDGSLLGMMVEHPDEISINRRLPESTVRVEVRGLAGEFEVKDSPFKRTQETLPDGMLELPEASKPDTVSSTQPTLGDRGERTGAD